MASNSLDPRAKAAPAPHARPGLHPALGLLRLAVLAQALLVLIEVGLAGGFLSGHFDLLAWHETIGVTAFVVALVTVGCAAWVRRRGGSRWLPITATIVLLAFVVQLWAGYSRNLWLHVPLGTLLVAALLMCAVLAVRPNGWSGVRGGTTAGGLR